MVFVDETIVKQIVCEFLEVYGILHWYHLLHSILKCASVIY